MGNGSIILIMTGLFLLFGYMGVPVAFALGLVALVVLCVVAPFRGIPAHRVPPAIWRITYGLRGLRVDVDSPEARVFVHFV